MHGLNLADRRGQQARARLLEGEVPRQSVKAETTLEIAKVLSRLRKGLNDKS